MNEFNPNCGKCGMLNSRGFCSLTACRYPSNVIVVDPTVIRGMMVNPQIELPEEFERRMAENKKKSLERCARVKKPMTNGDFIRAMSDYDLADWIAQILMYHGSFSRRPLTIDDNDCPHECPLYKCCNDQPSDNIEDWLKAPVEEKHDYMETI